MKIDLCKIIGVKELQEFEIINYKYRVNKNRMEFWSELNNKWILGPITVNEIVEIIDRNIIKI